MRSQQSAICDGSVALVTSSVNDSKSSMNERNRSELKSKSCKEQKILISMNSKSRFKMGLALVVSISLFWVSFMPLSYNGVYYQPSKNHTFKRSKWHFITLTQCSFVSYTYIYQMVFSSFMIYWVT